MKYVKMLNHALTKLSHYRMIAHNDWFLDDVLLRHIMNDPTLQKKDKVHGSSLRAELCSEIGRTTLL